MVPLIKRFFYDLFYSAERATLWFRGITTWFGVSAGLVVAYPPETIVNWKLKDWAIRFAIAGVTAIPMMKKAGEKNATPEQLAAKLASAGYVVTPPAQPPTTPPSAL